MRSKRFVSQMMVSEPHRDFFAVFEFYVETNITGVCFDRDFRDGKALTAILVYLLLILGLGKIFEADRFLGDTRIAE